MYHNGITYFEIYECMRCITSLDRYFCQIARVNWTEFLSSWSQMKLKMIISGTEFVERDLLVIFFTKVTMSLREHLLWQTFMTWKC